MGSNLLCKTPFQIPLPKSDIDCEFGKISDAMVDWTYSRFYRPLGWLDQFDGVCEGCGGHVHPDYMRSDPFRLYPRTRRRAVLFQSIESGALDIPSVRRGLESADLIICRTSDSCRRATALRTPKIVQAVDIVLGQDPMDAAEKKGFAVALRVPNHCNDARYFAALRHTLSYLEGRSHTCIDMVRVEDPIGIEMESRGYGKGDVRHIHLVYGDEMYEPFRFKRDGIVSCRLHTTLVALLHGNRQLVQYQLEGNTNKIREILDDIGLNCMPVYGREHFSSARIEDFLNDPADPIDEAKVCDALANARAMVQSGLDEFEKWLQSL